MGANRCVLQRACLEDLLLTCDCCVESSTRCRVTDEGDVFTSFHNIEHRLNGITGIHMTSQVRDGGRTSVDIELDTGRIQLCLITNFGIIELVSAVCGTCGDRHRVVVRQCWGCSDVACRRDLFHEIDTRCHSTERERTVTCCHCCLH